MNQRFDGPVDQVAAGDIINQITEPHGRRLVQAERNSINNMVRQLEDEFGDSGKATWRWLHGVLGVSNIEAMCLGHLSQATELMRLKLDLADAKFRLAQFDQIAVEVDTHLTDKEKLAEALKQSRRLIAATIRRAGEDSARLQSRISELEPLVAAGERAEQMLTVAMQRLESAEATLKENKRSSWMATFTAGVLLILSLGLLLAR